MSIPWTASIKSGGRLSVAPPSGSWSDVVRDALRQFNNISRSHHLCVTLVPGEGSAQVVVAAASSNISFAYDGTTYSERFGGSGLHGRTFQVQRQGSGIEKAYIFLPERPMVNTPRGQRPVGRGVKLLIAIHELVHACGLEDADHSDDDLFCGFPSVDYGSTAAADKVTVASRGITRRMPPLVLLGTTARLIKELWCA